MRKLMSGVCGMLKKHVPLFVALAFAWIAVNRDAADGVTIYSDTTWRVIGPVGNNEGATIDSVGLAWEAGNAGWNTSLAYSEPDATGGIKWQNAIYVDHSAAFTNPIVGSQTIWYNGTGQNGSTPSYFRKQFYLPADPLNAILEFGVDDDAKVFINGTQVINDTNHATSLWYAANGNAFDVTPYLHQGDNLIAVKAQDSVGAREWIVAKLDVNVVPEPSTLLLLGIGVISLPAYLRRRRTQKS
jgi:hypothetical protein